MISIFYKKGKLEKECFYEHKCVTTHEKIQVDPTPEQLRKVLEDKDGKFLCTYFDESCRVARTIEGSLLKDIRVDGVSVIEQS